ncbi:type II toxin-antitoxin system RelE/ParE family toxin [Myxococcota bacterium]|nr:type II toxin-antitoxin system RelE/ParE family toxin [Myxococcota bacterium]
MTLKYEITSLAEEQLWDLALWWSESRPDARSGVIEVFEERLSQILENPNMGTPEKSYESSHVRWVQLRPLPYKVYYQHLPGSDILRVLTVWSGARGQDPPL